ncbi:MAG: putative DNA binding domain-containing protein [Micropruina sp.]|uniref:RNA-binding domain-containing protein n=1 Tax=Micropruina sp. TaxID=2737536 RepID=UPI0039E669C4
MEFDLDAVLARGETFEQEFKRGSINDRELTEAVVCLANGSGGMMLVGVEDDGTVTGARARHGAVTDPYRLAATIQNLTEPAHPVKVRLVDRDDGQVIVITVPPADPGPIATKNGLYVKRALGSDGRPQCVPMTPHEIVSMGLVTRGIDYATSRAAEAVIADLDPAEFDRFRRLCSRSPGQEGLSRLSDRDILRALGLSPGDTVVSLGAVLLFGTRQAIQRWVPTAEFLFQDLRKGPSATSVRLQGPLFQVTDELERLLELRNTSTELMAGLVRIDLDLIPEITRREAVANALVHRDYTELGPTSVRITDSHLVVSSPGGFPPGVTVDNILDQSRPRSPILADAFQRAGIVDRKGKGVNEMFESQLRAGRDTPDYSGSTSSMVTVSVPLGTSDLDLVRFLLTFENDRQRPLTLDELRVVHEVKAGGSATNSELGETLRLAPSAIRSATARLVESGVLEARGGGRNRRVHLTARFYDLAQDRNAYVRIKAMDPLQQEQMVTEYVRTFGRITRSQAANLCQLSPVEAGSLLKRLVAKGVLRLIGTRRAAYYQLP